MKILYLTIILFFITMQSLISQAGMTLAELEKRLEPYYAPDLISDIKKQLPQGSEFSIWGYDVGDYSGDGYNDLAFSIKLAAEKKRVCQVYLFVDIDGFLTKTAQFPYEYVDLPLEIGVVIKYGVCYVTKKRKQYDWLVRGYQFDNGALIKLDEFSTKKVDSFTLEQYTNFSTLQNTEKYIKTSKGDIVFSTNYLVIPSYARGRQIYKGYQAEVKSNYIDYVPKGAYYWQGDSDSYFSVRSAYDNEFLYMTITVYDDKIVSPFCDTCAGDYIEVWFDVNPPEPESDSTDKPPSVKQKKKDFQFKKRSDKGIYCFKVYPGNFYENRAYVREVSTTDKLYKFQKEAASLIKASSSIQPEQSRYIIKFKVPFMIFGYDGPPVEEKKITEFGCTVVLHDIDNPYRPEEETQIATSVFDSSDPATYGSLKLIPPEMWYGEMLNIFTGDVLKYIVDLGF